MAKNRAARRRKFRKYLKGSIDHLLSLGTLNGNVVTSTNNSDAVVERAFLTSVLATWALDGFTPTIDDGPILVGLAHSDYTSQEIEDWIETSNSWNEGDQVQQEVAKRKIRRVGIFRAPTGVTDFVTLNDGKPIRTKCNWMLTVAQTIKIWAYNMGTGTLTTGAQVHVEGFANLWPN